MNDAAYTYWTRLSDLLVTNRPGDIAIIGAPMGKGSVTPGQCDLAPARIRETLRRFSTYDVETGEDLSLSILDAGDVPVRDMMPAEALEPIRGALLALTTHHDLTILLGGNNAVTRPGVHGLGLPLHKAGLITLDAHFDMRETDQGLMNGNPVRALLEDGLPGRNICQIGLLPFANTAKMHRDARDAGIAIYTMAECNRRGMLNILDEALARLSHVDAIMVDFDIDVIDRSQCPGAPGARVGGMPADMFFEAARYLGSQPKIRLVDLTEFDPSLDVGETSALAAGRWVCEVAAGYSLRAA